MDPAVIAVLGTLGGSAITLAGTGLTSWRTSKREARARLFTERRKAYAAVSHASSTSGHAVDMAIDEFFSSRRTRKSSGQRINVVTSELAVSLEDVRIVGSVKVREIATRYKHLIEKLDFALNDLMKITTPTLLDTPEFAELDRVSKLIGKIEDELHAAMRADLGITD